MHHPQHHSQHPQSSGGPTGGGPQHPQQMMAMEEYSQHFHAQQHHQQQQHQQHHQQQQQQYPPQQQQQYAPQPQQYHHAGGHPQVAHMHPGQAAPGGHPQQFAFAPASFTPFQPQQAAAAASMAMHQQLVAAGGGGGGYGQHPAMAAMGMGIPGGASALMAGQQSMMGGQGGGGGAKSSRICRHYARGRCTWGMQCRFTHEPSALGLEVGGLPGGGGMRSLPGGQFASFSPMDQFKQMSVAPSAGVAVSTRTMAPTAGPGGVTADAASRQQWLGTQQAQLQIQRHTILLAALHARFLIRQVSGADQSGQQKGQVVLTSLTNAPEIIISVLTDAHVNAALNSLESDERVREGGLHYLIGESSVFWSMMRLWHMTGSTTNRRWDEALERALNQGVVECMFYRSAAGCLAPRCNFEHSHGTAGSGGAGTSATPAGGASSDAPQGEHQQQQAPQQPGGGMDHATLLAMAAKAGISLPGAPAPAPGTIFQGFGSGAGGAPGSAGGFSYPAGQEGVHSVHHPPSHEHGATAGGPAEAGGAPPAGWGQHAAGGAGPAGHHGGAPQHVHGGGGAPTSSVGGSSAGGSGGGAPLHGNSIW